MITVVESDGAINATAPPLPSACRYPAILFLRPSDPTPPRSPVLSILAVAQSSSAPTGGLDHCIRVGAVEEAGWRPGEGGRGEGGTWKELQPRRDDYPESGQDPRPPCSGDALPSLPSVNPSVPRRPGSLKQSSTAVDGSHKPNDGPEEGKEAMDGRYGVRFPLCLCSGEDSLHPPGLLPTSPANFRSFDRRHRPRHRLLLDDAAVLWSTRSRSQVHSW